MKITDAFYAVIGAPVLAGRKLVEVGGKTISALRDGVKASTEEGRSVTEKYGEGNMVEELSNRLEVDERVGKLREQVEGVVDRWRDGFQADKKASDKKASIKKAPVKKAAAKATKKAPARKATVKKVEPAEKPVETLVERAEKVDVTA